MSKNSTSSYKTGWAREARETANERGVCVVCLSRKPAKGKAKCKPCSAASQEAVGDLRATAVERGVCIECLSRPPVDREYRGKPVARCQTCLDRAVLRRAAWMAKQK